MNVEDQTDQFILKHSRKSSAELALLLSKNKDLPKEYIINQINGKQKTASKFPFLSHFPLYTFPTPRAFAQASSEKTAKYKANILKAKNVLDLSGGMGMDSYFFAQHAEHSDYVELNKNLVEVAQSNFAVLGSKNIHCHHSKAEEFIEETLNIYDLIYLDPDRRLAKEKAFNIDDCEPNVSELLPLIWKKSKYCLVKLSPMLDIQQALTQLPFCKEVHVVAVDNDCKELLFLLEQGFSDEPSIKCINLNKKGKDEFEFNFEKERNSRISFEDVGAYLYEPNSAILKAGAFKSIATFYNIQKLATNTHLYTSSKRVEDFPGRVIKVFQASKPKKGMTQQANVVSRNFPLKPEQIKKKYKIKDGGNHFLYAFSLEDGNNQFVLGELM